MLHSRLAIRIVLGALALWLGLWPACDAVTSLSALSQLVPVAAAPAVAPAACCGEPAADAGHCAAQASRCHAAKPTARTAGCAQAEGPCTDGDGACAGTKAARCAQCFSLGGLLLFATTCLSVDPELALVGTLGASRVARASRRPQPLLRPPIPQLPLAA